MTSLHVSGHVRRVGNALAVLIPAGAARQAGLSPGDPVEVDVRSAVEDGFGMLKDLPFEAFDRRKEAQWRERV